jgi:chloramphenicol 3-O-phosphotransferase
MAEYQPEHQNPSVMFARRAVQQPPTMTESTTPIFILTGVPGSGKSSVARALMQRYPFGIHIPVDDLRDWVVSGHASPVPTWTDETSRQFALAYRAAGKLGRVYAEAGFAVALDHVFTPADAAANLLPELAGLAPIRVYLAPALAISLERNARRFHKPFDPAFLTDTIRGMDGWLAGQIAADPGWLRINSASMSVEQTVDAILAGIARERRPT